MVKSCCVKGCNSEWSPFVDISFFSFPLKNEHLLKQWLEEIPTNWKITKNLRICSLHFDKNCLEEKSGKRFLKKFAIPSVFPVVKCTQDLPEDSQNWMYFKTVGSCLLLKKDVVPHKNLRSNPKPTSPQLPVPEEEPKNNMVEVNLQKFKEENLENLRQLEQARKELNLQEVNLEKLREENLENLRMLEEARKKIKLRVKKKKKRKKVVKKKVEIEPPKSPTPPPEVPKPTFQTIAYLPTGLYNINAMPSISEPLLPYNYIQPDTYVNLCGQVLPPFIIQNEDQTQTCINAIKSTNASLLGSITAPLLDSTSAPILSSTSVLPGSITSPLSGSITAPLPGSLTAPLSGSITAPLSGSLTAPLSGSITTPVCGSISAPSGSISAPLSGSITAPLLGAISAPVVDYNNYLEPRTYVNVCGQQLVPPSIVENKYQETLETEISIKEEPDMGIENNGLYYPEVQIKEEIKDELIIKEEPITKEEPTEPANFEFVNMAPELENVFYNEDS